MDFIRDVFSDVNVFGIVAIVIFAAIVAAVLGESAITGILLAGAALLMFYDMTSW